MSADGFRRSSFLKVSFVALAITGILGAPSLGAAPKSPTGSLNWTGNGITADGSGGYELNLSLCGLDNGAEADGAYLVFVLSSTKYLTSPAIRFGPTDSWRAMTKMSAKSSATSSYKYVFESATPIDLAALLALPVTASWSGSAAPVLTIGRGCLGESSCASATAVLTNFASNTLSRIDVATGAKISPDLETGLNPNSVALTPDGAVALVTNQGSNSVGWYDVATGALLRTTMVGNAPFGIAIAPDGTTAVVANLFSDTVSLLDVASGAVLHETPVGANPYDVAITPDGTTAFVSNISDGTVSRISIATGQPIYPVFYVGAAPSGVTVFGDTLLVVNASSQTVSRIDLTTGAVVDIPLPLLSFKIAVTPDAKYAFVPNFAGESVTRIALSDNSTISIPLPGRKPFGVAITPDGTTAFITNYKVGGSDPGSVARIDVESGAVNPTDIAVGSEPEGIAITACSTD